MRFHPLINKYELLQDDFEIIQLGETAALDLSNEDTIWSNIQPRLKSKIRKTMKSGVKIYFSNDMALKDKFRAGASGSPLFDSKLRVYGLRTYGYDLYGGDDTRLGKVEYSGAESLYGYTGRFVRKHMY